MRLPTIALLCATLALSVACATSDVVDLQPGERPALETDEAGLWMYMEEVEHNLSTSGSIVKAPALNQYVRGIVCRLAPDHCPNMRIYVVQTPHFNASMAPNGYMQVWTGLILRAQNEAQLAYVLGHEIGHFLRRHSLQLWRDARAKSDFLAFFTLGAAAAGVGYVGNLAQLAALASIFVFSRENEREADDVGFRLMAKAGYDPFEAPKIWQALIEERDAVEDEDEAPPIFFATHPTTEERVATLQRLAEQFAVGRAAGVRRQAEILAATAPHRPAWLRGLLRIRNFERNSVVIAHLLENAANVGEIHFFQGEMHRLRGDKDKEDSESAAAAYDKAISLGGAPSEVHRSLGQVYWRMGQSAKAREAFERYLSAEPDAHDRAMIEAQIARMRKGS